MHILKYLKINAYNAAAACIIVFATGLRVLLVLLHWPATNGDEGVMANIAYNIAYRGEHPIMFYGQLYMGVIEAYLGAMFFHLTGGPSLTALRMGVVLLVTLFFICMYFLASLLFSKKLALVTIALLSVGSTPYLTRQTIATGGSTQTLFFGALTFLIASWLSLTYVRDASRRTRLQRLPLYGVFGIGVGLGIWSDMIALPYLGMATILLLLFCWREILVWGGWLLGLLGGLIGFFPSLWFGWEKGLNPFLTLFSLMVGSNPEIHLSLSHNIIETIQVTIPTATGFPFCPVIEYPFLGENTPRTLQCGIMQSTWGIGYVLLILTGLVFTVVMLRRFLRSKQAMDERERHQTIVRRVAQFLLLTAAAMVIIAFIKSTGPFNQPGYHARYLIGLLIGTPALLDSLWSGASRIKPQEIWTRVRVYSSRVILVAIALVFLSGTVLTFANVPQVQATDQQRVDLVQHLEDLHVTRFYTDYWSCYSLIFASDQRLMCAVVSHHLLTTHNRYPPFLKAVEQAKNASWMCPKNPNLTTTEYDCLAWLDTHMAKQPKGKYQRYEFDSYVLYKYMWK